MGPADALLSAALGFAQGYLGFPIFLWAPRLARVSLLRMNGRLSTPVAHAFCSVTIVVMYGLVQIGIGRSLLGLAPDPRASLRIWSLAFLIGLLCYILVPILERRVRTQRAHRNMRGG